MLLLLLLCSWQLRQLLLVRRGLLLWLWLQLWLWLWLRLWWPQA